MSGFRSVIGPSIPLDRPTYEVRIRHVAAYLTVESCGIFAIASAMCFTPSGPMVLLAILQATRVAVGQIQMRDSALYPTRPPYLSGADSTRGGILDRQELRHLRDRVGDVLHTLGSLSLIHI